MGASSGGSPAGAQPEGEPEWSPSGRRIAFAAAADIWVMNADGSARVNLTRSPTPETAVTWYPTAGAWRTFTEAPTAAST